MCIIKYGKDYQKKDKNSRKWNKMCDETDLCYYESTTFETTFKRLEENLADELEEFPKSECLETKGLIKLMKDNKIKKIMLVRD